jgi:hypothetical protein
VFDVVGEVFPSNRLEKLFREMYANNTTEEAIKRRIVEEVDVERFRRITQSTLEGLAKKELNLSAIIGKTTEAIERRLVPEVVEDFFIQAAPLVGVHPKEIRQGSHLYRVGRLPRPVITIGEKLESQFGKIGRDYSQVVFDKSLLLKEPTAEWITPGHPLFEAIREEVNTCVCDDLRRGSIFFDIHREQPYRLDVYTASIRDGRGNHLHRRLFVVQTEVDGTMLVKQPTIFFELTPAPKGVTVPDSDDLPDRQALELTLIERALQPFLDEVSTTRKRESDLIAQHIRLSMDELINRQNLKIAELHEQQSTAPSSQPFAANLKQAEDRLDELVSRRERRLEELAQERQCAISEIQHIGRVWVLPHPERTSPGIASMVSDTEIERIAVEKAIEYERERGWQAESVESENRGFDLISRTLDTEGPETNIEVRFIEVKGRAGVGEVALTYNEFKKAEILRKDYWLYVVYNCASKPEVHVIQDPIRLGWTSVMKVEHYSVGAKEILEAGE